MISGSCNDDLYARQGMEWPCYWISNLNGNVFPCMQNVSLLVWHVLRASLHHKHKSSTNSSISAKNSWLSWGRLQRARLLCSSGTTSFHSRLVNSDMTWRTILTMEQQPLLFRFMCRIWQTSSQAKANKLLTCPQVWSTGGPSPKPRGSLMSSNWPTLAHQRHFIRCIPLALQAPRITYLATAISSTNSGP